jgi:hypothetical protein
VILAAEIGNMQRNDVLATPHPRAALIDARQQRRAVRDPRALRVAAVLAAAGVRSCGACGGLHADIPRQGRRWNRADISRTPYLRFRHFVNNGGHFWLSGPQI